jgi:mono/diheme cytochrome c family protein
MAKYRTGWMTAAVVALAAGVLIQPAWGAGNAKAGKMVYAQKCQMCHAPDGNGNPGMAAALHVKFIPLGSPEIQKMTDAQIKEVITKGKGKMPAVQGITDADISNVIAYIRTFKKK